MSPRVFIFLMVVTFVGIWIGDVVAERFAAPGMERTFSVMVIAALVVAPTAWLLERLGYIRKENVELGRKRSPGKGQGDGGAA